MKCATLVIAMLWTLLAAHARADAPLDVTYELHGENLDGFVDILEDPDRALTFEDVQSPSVATRFTRHDDQALRFGYSRSAYWLRFRTHNAVDDARTWLLEVGFPQLDHVDLYVPRSDGGYELRATGDAFPFSERELSYRTFVFMLEARPASDQVYYLRVATTGMCNIPLKAWSLGPFAEHQHLDWAGICVFYGIVLMMAGYNLALFGFTREREYWLFAAFAMSMGLFAMTLVGHTFQFLLPNDPVHAQDCVPLSIAVCMVCMAALGRAQLASYPEKVRARRSADLMLGVCCATLGVALFLPFTVAARVVPATAALSSVVAFVGLWMSLWREPGSARLNLAGWTSMLVGAVVTYFHSSGALPENFFSRWSALIGASGQFVLVSAAMATKLTRLRRALHDANAELAQKVHALEMAVHDAEIATTRTERALRVKDEFMATMSHELRTPLNTIINVPQGLVEDFPVRRIATCASCHTRFELETDELVSKETRCPECYVPGLMTLVERAAYTGQPARTMHYLETIERSGKHLLQVVNDILRSERTEHFETELAYANVEATRLVRDVVDEMREWAERSGVALEVHTPSRELFLDLDPLRIRQVLLNLISNAIKFSSGRGVVTVTLRDEGDGCVMSVEDQGVGIPANKLETIFDSYRQAHDTFAQRFGGTGLGLAISRSLVRKHRGELWVESVLGRGATFSFRLPGASKRRLQRSSRAQLSVLG